MIPTRMPTVALQKFLLQLDAGEIIIPADSQNATPNDFFSWPHQIIYKDRVVLISYDPSTDTVTFKNAKG